MNTVISPDILHIWHDPKGLVPPPVWYVHLNGAGRGEPIQHERFLNGMVFIGLPLKDLAPCEIKGMNVSWSLTSDEILMCASIIRKRKVIPQLQQGIQLMKDRKELHDYLRLGHVFVDALKHADSRTEVAPVYSRKVALVKGKATTKRKVIDTELVEHPALNLIIEKVYA